VTEVSPQALLRFRHVLGEQAGLALDADKDALLSELLRERARKLELDADAYCARLEGRPETEISLLAEQLTVGETYFFRNTPHFRALREAVIPECVAALSHGRKLQLLSAGCATGEEPYSLAMLVDELHLTERAEVTAFDLNPSAIERAKRGVYSVWALRETPQQSRDRWFSNVGRDHVLDASVRGRVTFWQHSLMHDDPVLLPDGHYDVILCRNVLMYLEPSAIRAAVVRLGRALRPGGYLFLGHAETLRGVSQEFHLCHTHDTFYYQRKGTLDDVQACVVSNGSHRVEERAWPTPVGAVEGDWVGEIQRAADRIASLVLAPPRVEVTEGDTAIQRRDLQTAVLELMRREQSDQALALLRAGRGEAKPDSDTRLLEAALMLQQGESEAAEERCRELLRDDELSAGAHYILALCAERRGAVAEALRHDETAAYLDPGFAMPHVHRGMMLRRANHIAEARNALAKASALLETEDVARLILFGGGFDREALRALCRAELAAMEVRRE